MKYGPIGLIIKSLILSIVHDNWIASMTPHLYWTCLVYLKKDIYFSPHSLNWTKKGRKIILQIYSSALPIRIFAPYKEERNYFKAKAFFKNSLNNWKNKEDSSSESNYLIYYPYFTQNHYDQINC